MDPIICMFHRHRQEEYDNLYWRTEEDKDKQQINCKNGAHNSLEKWAETYPFYKKIVKNLHGMTELCVKSQKSLEICIKNNLQEPTRKEDLLKNQTQGRSTAFSGLIGFLQLMEKKN